MCEIGGPSHLAFNRHGIPINLNAKRKGYANFPRFLIFVIQERIISASAIQNVDRQKYFGTVAYDLGREKFGLSWYKSRKSESKVIINIKKMLNYWAYKCSSFQHIRFSHLYVLESLALTSAPKRLASGSTCPAYLLPGFWR